VLLPLATFCKVLLPITFCLLQHTTRSCLLLLQHTHIPNVLSPCHYMTINICCQNTPKLLLLITLLLKHTQTNNKQTPTKLRTLDAKVILKLPMWATPNYTHRDTHLSYCCMLSCCCMPINYCAHTHKGICFVRTTNLKLVWNLLASQQEKKKENLSN
jgi:hypothetical protein